MTYEEDLEYGSKENIYYSAWDGLPRNKALSRLKIRARRSSRVFMPRYDLLYDIPHSLAYDFVGLVFAHLHVRIHGRHLGELVTSLHQGRVARISEFLPDSDTFPSGIDPLSQPCIDQILVQGAPSLLFDER